MTSNGSGLNSGTRVPQNRDDPILPLSAAWRVFAFFIATNSMWHILVASGSRTSECYGQGENALIDETTQCRRRAAPFLGAVLHSSRAIELRRSVAAELVRDDVSDPGPFIGLRKSAGGCAAGQPRVAYPTLLLCGEPNIVYVALTWPLPELLSEQQHVSAQQ